MTAKKVSKTKNTYKTRVDSVNAIFGVVPLKISEKEIQEERTKKI